MPHAGDEYRYGAINNAIAKVGAYNEFVEIRGYDFEVERGCTCKINKKVPETVIKKK